MRVSARLSAVVMFAAIGVLALMFAGLLDWIVGVLFLLMEFLGETLRNIFARSKRKAGPDTPRHRPASTSARSLVGRGRGLIHRRGRPRRRPREAHKDGLEAPKAEPISFRVLVPLSANDAPLIDFALEECLVRRAELLLLFLRPMGVVPMGPNPLPGFSEDDEAKATFDSVAERAGQSGVPLRTFYETTSDRPATIGEVARATEADVVIVGSARRNGVTRFLTRDPNPSILKLLPERASLMIHASSRSCPGHTCSEDTRAQWMRLLPFMLMVSSIMGCLGTSSNQPLTTADLERMAVGKVVFARLERVGNRSAFSLENDPSGISSRILRSMSPVISSNAAVSSDIATEYRFMFQSGRNPIDFSIRVCGDVLCYRVGNTDYKGGNAKDFLSAVGELKWAPMTISVP